MYTQTQTAYVEIELGQRMVRVIEREGGRERTQRFYYAIICHLILLFVLIFLDIVVVAAGYKIKIQIQIKAEWVNSEQIIMVE